MRVVVFVAAVVVIVAAGGLATRWLLGGSSSFEDPGTVVSAGHGDAPVDEVVSRLGAAGVQCDPPGGPGFDTAVTDGGASDGGLSDDGRRLLDNAVRDGAGVEYRTCGRSTIASVGSTTRAVLLVAVDPAVAKRVADTGAPVVSLAPPRTAAVVDAIEAQRITCLATPKQLTRAVLTAQTAALAASGGPPVSPAQADALQRLPDTKLTVTNCNGITIIGVGEWAQVVTLTPDVRLDAGPITALGPVLVVG